MTMFAAEKMDSGDYARIELAACKANGAQALCRVMDRAVQVFGAKGLTDDTPLGSMYRHARAARFYDGPDEVHITTVGRLMQSIKEDIDMILVLEHSPNQNYDILTL